MPKLYTKTGDKGTTCLYDMRSVSKSNIIIDFLGDLDELSAHIGLLCAFLGDKVIPIMSPKKQVKDWEKVFDNEVSLLRKIQSKLLDIGSNIATTNKDKRTTHITPEDVKELENQIDECEKHNEPLREFILPGVKPHDAQIHVCRSVCRRVERKLVALLDNNVDVNQEILQYINRLSDYFFALARNVSGCKETLRSQS